MRKAVFVVGLLMGICGVILYYKIIPSGNNQDMMGMKIAFSGMSITGCCLMSIAARKLS